MRARFWRALCATATLGPLQRTPLDRMAPVEVEGEMYRDGSHVANTPLAPLLERQE